MRPEDTAMAGGDAEQQPVDLDLRDYFAGLAMQEHMRALSASAMHENVWHDHIARLAWRTADAMLRARSA